MKNIVPYYSQNIQFSGKTSEEKYAASLGTKAKQIFFKETKSATMNIFRFFLFSF